MVVILVLGLVALAVGLLAVPAAMLLAFAFAAVGMAATTFMRSWQDFDLINLVVLPLFLFCGTFYPITAYPEPLQVVVRLTPLWQGVDMIRALIDGLRGPVDPVARRVPRASWGWSGWRSWGGGSTGCCSSRLAAPPVLPRRTDSPAAAACSGDPR